MTNAKLTKRALVSSIISLVLCVSMFVGTTFAWFTDSVTSANNIIKSGNLDIELEYYAGEDTNGDPVWNDVNGASDILTNTLWEPGTTEIAYLRFRNAGSLALKYQLGVQINSETAGVNVAGQEFKLSNYLYYDVIDRTETDFAFANRDAAIGAVENAAKLSVPFAKSGALEANSPDVYLALVVYMPTTVGNEANHNGVNVPQIDLGINIVATQMTSEQDSFDDQYDNGAFIPVAPEAVPEAGKNLVLNGSDESKVQVTVPATVIAGLNNTVTSLSIAASAPVVDATNKTVTFSTIELVDQNGEEVDLSAANAKVTVTLPVGEAFANGETVEVYHDGQFVTYATVENGNISYEVSHFCEVTVKAAEEVTLDNVIDNVKEFVAFAAAVNAGKTYAGETVTLGADLDLAGVTWTPIGNSTNPFKGTFDGNGKTIKNLSVLMAGKSDVGLFGFTTDGEIKNVTIENAKVAGRLDVGVVAGTPYTTKYTNITVKGHVEVDGMAYVGAVGGKNAYANWTDIVVNVDATSYVNANSVENGKAYRTYVGGVVGFNGEGAHTFKNITTNINVYGSTCDIGGAFGIAHYGNNFENVTVTGVVTAGEDAFEVGAIAGVWHNENGTTVTIKKCTYTSNLPVVGSAYAANKTGKLIIDGEEVVASSAALQNALNANQSEIVFVTDIVGDVIVTQKAGVNVVIDGNNRKYDGTIYIYGQARHDGAETLTIKNVNFASENAKDFISSNSTDGDKRYAHNVTVEDCSFTGADGAFGCVGIRYRQAYNMSVVNCTATNLHSLIQTTGGVGITVTGAKVDGCKNGMSFGTTDKVTVENSTIKTVGDYSYGVRVDASNAYTATITGNTITAAAGVLFRKATGAYTATVNDNDFVDCTYTVLTTDTDYENDNFAATTGNLNITVDDVVAVATGDALKAALKAGKNVVFANNITMKATETNGYGATGIAVNGQTVNGNGYTLTVTNAGGTWDSAIYIKSGKIQNITVKGPMRGVFTSDAANGDIYLEKVTFANVVYTFNSDGSDSVRENSIYITDCVMNGWTSFSNTHEEVVFTNCTFGEGSGYAFCRPYNATRFVNCTFEAGYTIDKTKTPDITFENCTFAE